MMSYSPAPSAVVIDASAAIRGFLPVKDDQSDILRRFATWRRSGIQILAPEIWLPEVISTIRKAVYSQLLTEDEGHKAVEDVFQMGVDIVLSDLDLCQNALRWATRLGQSKAYDGFYLALAEKLSAELWTADLRLSNQASQIGVAWVHSIGN